MVEVDPRKNWVAWWVPSQVGEEFRVTFNIDTRHGSLRAKVTADGAWAHTRIFQDKASWNVASYRESPTLTRPFIFSRVELVGDDNLLNALDASRVGKVKIDGHLAHVLIYFVVTVSFGDTVAFHKPRGFHNSTPKEHLVTFVFRYCPLDYLQAQGTALSPAPPRSASQQASVPPAARQSGTTILVDTKSVQEIDPSDEDDEEIRALLAQVDEARARKRKYKENARSCTKREFEVIANSGTRARGPWGADVRADGTLTSSPVFLGDQSCNVGYYRKSSTVQRPFSFSKLDLVDDDTLLNSAQGSRIGEIEITCYTVEITSTYEQPDYDASFADNSKLHERSKKGVTERIGFKKDVATKPCKFYNARNLEYIGTFVFRYRPLAYLQAQGIAPVERQLAPVTNFARPGSSTSELSSRNNVNEHVEGTADMPLVISDDEGDPEVHALQAQLAQAKPRLKRKRDAENGSQQKRVKVEGTPVFLPGEVIDLT
ncbi:hypothetical protein AN958_02504 [Leucoagaricus sp. SymC.cos]|nr:hypothetical protein AN958_02504 [Leucoagaricus sp. SymC.cos]